MFVRILIALVVSLNLVHPKDELKIPYGEEEFYMLSKEKSTVSGQIHGTLSVRYLQSMRIKTLNLENIQGDGKVSVEVPDDATLIIENVKIDSLDIKLGRNSSIYLGNKNNEIDELFIDVTNDARSINLNNKLKSKSIKIIIQDGLTELNIEKIEFLELDILGKTSKSRINEVLILINNAIHEQINLNIDSLVLQKLSILDVERSNKVYAIPPNITLRVSNLYLDASDILIDSYKFNSIELRGIYKKKSFNTSILIKNASPKVEYLVLSDISKVGTIELDMKKLPKMMILNNIHTNNLIIGFHDNYDLSTLDFKVSSLIVKHSLRSEEQIITLAEKNSAKYPHEVLGFFDLLLGKSYLLNQDHSVVFPRFQVLELRQLKELSYRPIIDKVFGYTIYLLSGFGSNILIPIYFWLFIILISSLCYFFVLKGISSKKNYFDYLLASSIFSLSFTMPSRDNFYKHLGLKLNEKTKLISLAYFQGILSIIQLTLISIFFSQTTIP